MRNLLLSLTFLAACGGAPPAVTGPASTSAPKIQVFTEPSEVAAIVPVGGSVFIATSQGLDRWETHGGKRARLGAKEGIEGSQVRILKSGYYNVF